MSRWFRYYDEALDDPKVQRLPGELFKFWINILCLASRHEGRIPPTEDVAFSLRITETVAARHLETLSGYGLLDLIDNNVSVPHNWEGRQFKTDVSTERVKQFRKRQMKRDETVSETSPDTEQITDTELPHSPQSKARTKESFERFKSSYPKRAGSNPWEPARQKFERAIGDGVDPEAVISGAKRYASEQEKLGKVGTEFIAQAVTWLNQKCWRDYGEQVGEANMIPKSDPQWPLLSARFERENPGKSLRLADKWPFPESWLTDANRAATYAK